MPQDVDVLFENWVNKQDAAPDEKELFKKDPKAKLLFMKNMGKLITRDVTKFPPDLPKQQDSAPMGLQQGAFAPIETRNKMQRQGYAGVSPETLRTGLNVGTPAAIGGATAGPLGALAGASGGVIGDIFSRLTDSEDNPEQFSDVGKYTQMLSGPVLSRLSKLKGVGRLAGQTAISGAEGAGIAALGNQTARGKDETDSPLLRGFTSGLLGGPMHAFGNALTDRANTKTSQNQLTQFLSDNANEGQSTKAAADLITQNPNKLQSRLAFGRKNDLIAKGVSPEAAIDLGLAYGEKYKHVPGKLSSLAGGSPEKLFESTVEPLVGLRDKTSFAPAVRQFKANLDEVLTVVNPADKPELMNGIRAAMVKNVLASAVANPREAGQIVNAIGNTTIEKVFGSREAANKLTGLIEGSQSNTVGARVKLFFDDKKGELGILMKNAPAVGGGLAGLIEGGLGGMTKGAIKGAATAAGVKAGYKVYNIGADRLASWLSNGNNRFPEILSALATNRGTYTEQTIRNLEKYLDKTARTSLSPEEESGLTRDEIRNTGGRIMIEKLLEKAKGKLFASP